MQAIVACGFVGACYSRDVVVCCGKVCCAWFVPSGLGAGVRDVSALIAVVALDTAQVSASCDACDFFVAA